MRLVCHAGVCIKNPAESLTCNTFHLITFLLWAFKARKALSMSSFLMERIFWSPPNGILTAYTEWLPGVWLRHSVSPVQYIQRIVTVSACPAVMARWQNTGSCSQQSTTLQCRHVPCNYQNSPHQEVFLAINGHRSDFQASNLTFPGEA